jgi:hypothetical protein
LSSKPAFHVFFPLISLSKLGRRPKCPCPQPQPRRATQPRRHRWWRCKALLSAGAFRTLRLKEQKQNSASDCLVEKLKNNSQNSKKCFANLHSRVLNSFAHPANTYRGARSPALQGAIFLTPFSNHGYLYLRSPGIPGRSLAHLHSRALYSFAHPANSYRGARSPALQGAILLTSY